MRVHPNISVYLVAFIPFVTMPFAAAQAASSPTTPQSSVPSSSVRTTVTVTWQPNTEPDLAGYKLYVGTSPGVFGAPIVVGKVTSYQVTGLMPGNTYYFAVSAYDANGNESQPSAVLSTSIY
jgi:hypothetical protein